MESSYLTVDFFRKLPQEMEKAGNLGIPSNPAQPTNPYNRPVPNPIEDRYGDRHFRSIGSNVSSYIGLVSDTLKITIPNAVVYCQVREAKLSLLSYFFTQIGKKEMSSVLVWYFLSLSGVDILFIKRVPNGQRRASCMVFLCQLSAKVWS